MATFTFLYVKPSGYNGITPTNMNELFNSLGINYGNNKELYEKIKSDDFTCEPFSKKDINKYLENSICIYLKNSSDEITGICCIRFKTEIIFLTFICVPPKGKGNGKMLLGKIKDISDEIGYTIELDSMPNVVKYYQNNGFEIKDSEIDQISKRHNVTTDDFSVYGTIDMSYKPKIIPLKETVSRRVDLPKKVKFTMRLPVRMRYLPISKRNPRKKRTIRNNRIYYRTGSLGVDERSRKSSNKRKAEPLYPPVNKSRRLHNRFT